MQKNSFVIAELFFTYKVFIGLQEVYLDSIGREIFCNTLKEAK